MFLANTKNLFLPVLAVLSACQTMPEQPDYSQQVVEQQQQLSNWSAQEEAVSLTTLSQLFESEPLDALIAEAIEANPGLQQTWLTLQIRQAEKKQVQADQRPSVDFSYAADKTEDVSTNYTSTLNVSWEMDIWGKLANNTSAENFDIAQHQALYQAARDTLGADVIKNWLNRIAQQHAIAIEQKRLNTLEKNEQFILQRYRNGLGTLQDLDTARSSTASSRANIESLKQGLQQLNRTLNVLVGRVQDNAGVIARNDIEYFSIDYPEVIVPLADLPEQTLQRRPDLRAAYQAIEAESLRTEVAYKNMLPSIDLGVTLTDMATSPTSALLTGPIWSLLAQLTAPIYRGGELKATAEIAELQTAIQFQAYRETLLTAVNEVEDALGLEQSLALQQQHLTQAFTRSRNTLQQYQKSYRSGLNDILDLLNVQQQTYDLEAQLDNVIYQRLSNRVDLGLALGLPVIEGVRG